ncbi:tRNA lysidine(34) synthetase TilS [Methylotetracoccus oryzae]|uniref:tRNA lysidine(34) synthetase TilS n=1 Tax=Methylotetracoccus oryzae TaxID=1919059 RepID=UPI001F29FF9C|nr:tRNA lysidine(34) synthetase TilS [Methylotetracoccus oryzae]
MRNPVSSASLAAFLNRHPSSPRYWVALSGGLDSTVLLHLCHALRSTQPDLPLTAAHIHHGLQHHADDWVASCAEACRALDIPLTICHVDARPKRGESPEAAARDARYTALSGLLGTGDTLLTAQHRDDQAETLLLQLLRGAGVAGLAAMPERAAFGPGFLARPLLQVGRAELTAYAEEHQLRWVEDPSNSDIRFARNYLRREIMPMLRARWPGADQALARSSAHCAETKDLLDELAAELLHRIADDSRDTLVVARLAELAPAQQRLVLRHWLSARGCTLPSTVLLERIRTEVCRAGRDRQPVVAWSDVEVRRFRGQLHLCQATPNPDPSWETEWDGRSPLLLPPNNGRLLAERWLGPGLDPAQWHEGRITVRYRRGGESLRLPDRGGSRELKKLLNEAGVPYWERNRIPLIYIDAALAAVADRWVDETFAGNPATESIRIRWDRSASG